MKFKSCKIFGNADRGKYYVVREYNSTTTADQVSRTSYMTKDEYETWKETMMSVVGQSHELVSKNPSQIVFTPLSRNGA